MADLKEILGEDLFEQVQEKVRGAGSNGKDIEIIATNTGDYVPAKKYEDVKVKYEKFKNDFDVLNSNFDSKIKEAEEKSFNLLKRTTIESKLEALGVSKINNSYDVYLNGSVVDLSKIEVKDGKVLGVEDVVNGFVTANPHLISGRNENSTENTTTTTTTSTVAVPAAQGVNPSGTQGTVKDSAYYKAKMKEAVDSRDLATQSALIREAAENKIIIN